MNGCSFFISHANWLKFEPILYWHLTASVKFFFIRICRWRLAGMGGERSEPPNNKKTVKNSLQKKCQKITPKNSKNCQKITPKFKKCKKLQNWPGLPVKQKSVPPSHIVRFYPQPTSTKSVLRQASTRLARAEI